MSAADSLLPPGPRSSAAWQLWRYTRSPLSFLESCLRDHGDPFTVRMAGYGTFVMLSSPEAVRDVFRGSPEALHSGEGNAFLSATVGDTSVLVLDEDPHARQRRVLLPTLKGERMRSFFQAIQSATIETVRGWQVSSTIGVVEPMQRITLRVILQTVLGLEPGQKLAHIEDKVRRLLALTRSRYSLVLMKILPVGMIQQSRWLPFGRHLHELDKALYSIVEECRGLAAERRVESVLADLLETTHENGAPLSNREIRDAVVTLLIAGHETTALALAWAIEQIVERADVVERIVEEGIKARGSSPLQEDHLSKLEYLDASIRESLRVRTILAFVVRVTKQPFVAGGREYPAGILLSPCNHLVHQREDLYPDPMRFRPERFLERRFGAHEWFPFGGGNRMCLGMAFALYEMKVVLATLFSKVRLARPRGSKSYPVRRGLTLAPHDNAIVTIQEKIEL